jgi:hypothetical protein
MGRCKQEYTTLCIVYMWSLVMCVRTISKDCSTLWTKKHSHTKAISGFVSRHPPLDTSTIKSSLVYMHLYHTTIVRSTEKPYDSFHCFKSKYSFLSIFVQHQWLFDNYTTTKPHSTPTSRNDASSRQMSLAIWSTNVESAVKTMDHRVRDVSDVSHVPRAVEDSSWVVRSWFAR